MTRTYNLYQGNGTNKKIYVTGEKTILNFRDMTYSQLNLPSGQVSLEDLEDYVYGNKLIIYYGSYEDRVIIKNIQNFSYAKRPNFIIRTTDGDKNIADMFTNVYLDFDDYYFRVKHYIGTFFNDYVLGNNLSNIIKGGAGDDHIYGNAGKDKLYGGIGSDALYGGIGNDYVYGNSGNDFLYGDEGNDHIYGGSGSDEIHAGDGTDYINAGSGNNTIYGDYGKCTIRAGSGNNTITGSTDKNDVRVGNGHNTITTYSANDYIKVGNGSNNSIDAGAGTNTIVLGKGKNNVVYVTSGGVNNISYNKAGSLMLGVNSADINALTKKKNDLIVSCSGGTARIKNFFSGKFKDIQLNNSTIVNVSDSYRTEFYGKENKKNNITGTNLSDEIYGGYKNDVLKGKYGNDIIYTGEGNDKVYGGRGNDEIHTDMGKNTLYFAKNDGDDKVYYGYGTDILVFTDVKSFKKLELYKQGNDLIITHNNGTVTLKSVNSNTYANTYLKVGSKKISVSDWLANSNNYLGASPDLNNLQLETVSWKTVSDSVNLDTANMNDNEQIDIETLVFADTVK